jgi:MFS family permease
VSRAAPLGGEAVAEPPEEGGLLGPRLRRLTTGLCSLFFLVAFLTLAITTIMPVIGADLDGGALYSAAFATALAAGVVGTAAAPALVARAGVGRSLLAAVATFLVGVAGLALAPTMLAFVAARTLQGLGSGAVMVVLYVVVGRFYPARLHPAIFAAFAGAWLVPALVGPVIAGVVADLVGWRWVFAVVALATPVVLLVLRPLIRATLRAEDTGAVGTDDGRRILLALAAAAAVLVVSAPWPVDPAWSWLFVVLPLPVVALVLARLLPRGALVAAAGLPAAVLLRGVVSASFMATDAFLPTLLVDRQGIAAWQAGLVVTVGGVSWGLASAVQARLGDRLSSARSILLGSSVLVAGIAGQLVATVLDLGILPMALAWLVAGAGMGLVYPRDATLVMAYSPEGERPLNSSRMLLGEQLLTALAIAVAGALLPAALPRAAPGLDGFALAQALSLAIAIASVGVAVRAGGRRMVT